MQEELKLIKIGLFLVMLSLLFGVSLGVVFGVAEDSVKGYITKGIKAHPKKHDKKSKGKIWRYAQRAHFHSTGIAAFALGLLLLVMFSSLKKQFKTITSILIGLSGLYPLSWFTMFLLSPDLGRKAAHSHLLTELFVYIGTGGLLLGMGLLSANLFLDMFTEAQEEA